MGIHTYVLLVFLSIVNLVSNGIFKIITYVHILFFLSLLLKNYLHYLRKEITFCVITEETVPKTPEKTYTNNTRPDNQGSNTLVDS